MPRFYVTKTIIADFSAYVTAENEDEVMDIINDDGIEWDFEQQDDKYEIEEITNGSV